MTLRFSAVCTLLLTALVGSALLSCGVGIIQGAPDGGPGGLLDAADPDADAGPDASWPTPDGGTDHPDAGIPADDLMLTVSRLAPGSGEVLVSNGIPLLQGQITPESLDEVSLWVNGVEQAIYAEGLGRFEDLSYRALLVQFPLELTEGSPVPGALRIGVPPTRPRREKVPITFEDEEGLPRRRSALHDVNLLGYPDAVALPAAAWFRQTQVFWDVVEEATIPSYFTDAEEVLQAEKYVTHFHRWFRDHDWSGSLDGFERNTIANYPSANRYHWHSSQPQPWSGPVPPEYGQWRSRFAEPTGGPGFNYYDAAMISFARFAMTDDLTYFKRAFAYAWGYAYAVKYEYRNIDGSHRINNWDYVQSKQYMPEGIAMAYLMSGDPMFLDMLQQASGSSPRGWSYMGGFAVRYHGAPGLGLAADWLGEGRPIARILLGRLWAWKISRPSSETTSPSRETRDWAAAIQDGVDRVVTIDERGYQVAGDSARRADGRWVTYVNESGTPPCASDPYAYYTTFMQPMVNDALIKVHESFAYRRADIVAAVRANLDYLWTHAWGFVNIRQGVPQTTLAFDAWFDNGNSGGQNCTPPRDGAPDLTNMYPHAWAWYAAVSGESAYAARARTIFRWAVGSATDGHNGPYLAGSDQSARKVRREYFCFSQNLFGFLGRVP
jgi:hypothetical protein